MNNIILQGIVPSMICPIFNGSKLIALSKDDGGVCLIAIGMTLRCLAGKVVMTKLKDRCVNLFQPHQPIRIILCWLAVEQTERNCVFREMAKQIFMILVSGEIFYCLAGYYAILEHPKPQGGVA